ncbi:MAG: hypothetical protein OXF79_19365 [Chloroflexi bacterium]|nr:hypothetical protein [Chloroflexota bacterium]
MARAKAILTLTDFIRDLDDGYSERQAFIHPVAARQCDNCGYRCDDPARIPRRLLGMCLDDARESPCCCDVCPT